MPVTGVDLGLAVRLIVILLISITVHELAHAVTAVSLGDDTPRRNGQLSLNPMVHMEPYAIVILFVSAFLGFVFAFGRTFINPNNLKFGPQRGGSIVAVAGPASNLTLALILAAVVRINEAVGCHMKPDWIQFLLLAMSVNISLVILNLIPVPPLDGFAILSGFLTARQLYSLAPLVQYGPILLFLLLFFGVGPYLFSWSNEVVQTFFPSNVPICGWYYGPA